MCKDSGLFDLTFWIIFSGIFWSLQKYCFSQVLKKCSLSDNITLEFTTKLVLRKMRIVLNDTVLFGLNKKKFFNLKCGNSKRDF